MNIIYDIGTFKPSSAPGVLAIGVFDGLHKGHQALIKRVIKRARILHGRSMVMTFSPHPVHVLHPEAYMPLVVSLEHRVKLIKDAGIDVCFVVKFTKAFSRLSPQQFVDEYLRAAIQPKEIFVGDDFRFGQNRAGTLDYFQQAGSEQGFKVKSVIAIKGGQNKIGSTRIRYLVTEGQLDEAKKFLGRPVAVMGVVTKGSRRGVSLGYPTANIYPEHVVVPPTGVYAVKVDVGGKQFCGMANVGHRPTFHKAARPNIEAHIFNFNKNIYGQTVIIYFIKKIREEIHFSSKEDLIAQIKRDEKKIRPILLP